MAVEPKPDFVPDEAERPNLPHRGRRFRPPGTPSGPPGVVIPFPTREGAPTPQETNAANAGELAPRGVERFLDRVTRSWAVRLGLVTAGGIWSYQNIPAFHQFVDDRYRDLLLQLNDPDLLKMLGIEMPVPAYFDNNANKGVIGKNNAQVLNVSKIQQSLEQAKYNNTTLSILFPFQLPDGSVACFEKGLSDRLPDMTLRAEAERQGIKDYIELTLPKDTIIVAPTSGYVLIARGSSESKEDPSQPSWARVFYYDQNTNRTYLFDFFDLPARQGEHSYLSLLPMIDFSPDIGRDTSWQNLPKINRGEWMLRMTEDGRVKLKLKVYAGKTVGPQAEIIDHSMSLATINFFTQNDKVIMPK